MVYSYFESLREDPSGSTAGFDQGRTTVMVCFSSGCLFVACKLWSYPVISFPLVRLLLSLLPWLTLFVFPEPYSPYFSLFSLQISLSILFLNLSVWPLKWKKWVLTWVWSYFWWSHKNGFNVFFCLADASGRSSTLRKVLSRGSCRVAKKLNCLQSPLFSLDHRDRALTN